MTDLPDTDTLKGLLANILASTGITWAMIPMHIAEGPSEVRAGKGWLICCVPSDEIARLIALAPTLAARVIEQDAALAAKDARIARLTEALRLHQAWSDSEDAGPDYGAQTRDTHPDGERIWRQWWDGNLDLCARAQEATRAALEDGQ